MRHICRVWLCFTAMVLGLSLGESQAQERGIGDFPKLNAKTDWPWWRGPSRNGVADAGPAPTKTQRHRERAVEVPPSLVVVTPPRRSLAIRSSWPPLTRRTRSKAFWPLTD